MESRPDLTPPCCAACVKAGDAEVTWDEGWTVRHGTETRTVANGAEAREALRVLHYELMPHVEGVGGVPSIPAGVPRIRTEGEG